MRVLEVSTGMSEANPSNIKMKFTDQRNVSQNIQKKSFKSKQMNERQRVLKRSRVMKRSGRELTPNILPFQGSETSINEQAMETNIPNESINCQVKPDCVSNANTNKISPCVLTLPKHEEEKEEEDMFNDIEDDDISKISNVSQIGDVDLSQFAHLIKEHVL